jgi:hypothetical protein
MTMTVISSDDSKRSAMAAPSRDLGHRAEALIRRLEGIDVGAHPLFRRLAARPFDRAALWLLLTNLYASVGESFADWLLSLISVVDDPRIRSIVVKQLSDELGDGDYTRMHTTLFAHFIAGIEPWRPGTLPEGWSAPGAALGEGMTRYMMSPEPYCRVGAVMASEIYAKKFDICLGREIDRQDELSASALEWLRAHLTLEVGHADGSLVLARLLPSEGPALEAALRGAEGIWSVFWTFLDDMHRVCSL